jgi:hypothetical protein
MALTLVVPTMVGSLEQQARESYAAEDLRWIDVQRYATEPRARFSSAFGDAAARPVLDAFRAEHDRCRGLRRPAGAAPPADHVHQALQGLGYVEPRIARGAHEAGLRPAATRDGGGDAGLLSGAGSTAGASPC